MDFSSEFFITDKVSYTPVYPEGTIKTFRLSSALIIVLSTVLMPFCSRKFGMERGFKAVETVNSHVRTGKCCLVRTRFIEITAEPVDVPDWIKLLKYPPHFGKKEESKGRIPKLQFFQLVLHNVSKHPIPLNAVDIMLHFGTYTGRPLTLDQVKRACKSPAYSIINFEKLMSTKRLTGDNTCISSIHYDRDLVDYRLNFINPDDRVIKIVAFQWIPVEYRSFKLKVRYSLKEYQKSIDFEFDRFEYRTRGKHFRMRKASPKEHDA